MSADDLQRQQEIAAASTAHATKLAELSQSQPQTARASSFITSGDQDEDEFPSVDHSSTIAAAAEAAAVQANKAAELRRAQIESECNSAIESRRVQHAAALKALDDDHSKAMQSARARADEQVCIAKFKRSK
jgi:voltage-gated potassium channel Kch